MFTLWYSVLSWKEYREIILGKVSQKLAPGKSPKPQSIPPPPPPPTPSKPEVPNPPASVPKAVPPPKAPAPPKLDPPPKPPRSPSPHPLRTEAFEDLEYEDEESEEEDEEDEDSVVDSVPPPKKPEKTVNDFISVEIDRQRRDFGPQRYPEQVVQKSNDSIND